jgi:hypothetical protein
MKIFVFGGFFGIVTSLIINKTQNGERISEKIKTNKWSATLALIGTLFCWALFPILSKGKLMNPTNSTFLVLFIANTNSMKFES